MWKPRTGIPFNRNFQLDVRPYHHLYTDAAVVGFKAASVEEMDPFRLVWFRLGVSGYREGSFGLVFILISHFINVCIITLLRVVAVVQLNGNMSDITYSVVDDSIYSTIESTLGITNACLMVLRPVVEKLRHHFLRDNPSWPPKALTNLKNLSKEPESDTRNFHRLQDNLDQTERSTVIVVEASSKPAALDITSDVATPALGASRAS